jgi:esterase/lipase
MKAPDWQGQADREARRLVREAYAAGRTVGYSLGRLLELKLSLRVVRAVYRGKQ